MGGPGGGRSLLVPAGPARAHIEALRAAGAGTRGIAAAAGVARNTVSGVAAGRKTRIRFDTSRRLLAVSSGEVGGRALVDAGPTIELLDRLDALGYSPSWIAAQLQLGSSRRLRLQVGRHRRVRARTARAVAELATRVDRPAGADGRGAVADV